MSLTLNMTALEDNQAIFVKQIIVGGVTYRFCDGASNITLSSNTYYHNCCTFGEIDERIDLSSGGGISDVSDYQFMITENDVSGFSNRFNDFYPVSLKPYLINSIVKVGIVWDGATTESQITWLAKFAIDDIGWDKYLMEIKCRDATEIQNKTLPNFQIQDQLDDSVSYFPNAPEESLGIPIPFVYGDYSNYENLEAIIESVAPTILVDPYTSKYIIASHKLDTAPASDTLLQYTPATKSYCQITSTDGNTTNNEAGCSVQFIQDTTSPNVEVLGTIYVLLRDVGYRYSDIKDFADIYKNSSSVTVADTKSASFRWGNSSEALGLGLIGTADSDMRWVCRWASDSGGTSRYMDMYIYDRADNNSLVGVGNIGETTTSATSQSVEYDFGSDLTSKQFDRIQQLEFRVFNTSGSNGSSGAIEVFRQSIQFSNIKIYKPSVETKKEYYRVDESERYAGQGLGIMRVREVKIVKPTKVDLGSNPMMGSIIGRKFGGWVA